MIQGLLLPNFSVQSKDLHSLLPCGKVRFKFSWSMGYLNPKSLQGLREKSLAQKFTKDYDVSLDVVRVLAPSHHMLPEMTSYFNRED